MNKNRLIVVIVAILVSTAGLVIFSKINMPSLKTTTIFPHKIKPTSTSNPTVTKSVYPLSPSSPDTQIRTLNSILNEYNTYNNAAKQMNTSSNPL